MLPKTLSQHLAAVHDRLSLIFTYEATDVAMSLIQELMKNPLHLRPLPQVPPVLEAKPPYGLSPTYFRMDEHLQLVEAGPALVALLGVPSVEDLYGDKWDVWLTPDERERIWEQWMYVAQTKGGYVCVFRYTTPSGHQMLLRQRVWPHKDPTTLAFLGWVGHVEAINKVLKMEGPSARTSESQQSA